MEIKFPASEPVFRIMSPETTVPQKRKSIPDEEDAPDRASPAPTSASRPPSNETTDPQLSPNEYKTGRITCDDCGKRVSFRDDTTGGFTVKHWDLHRQECPNASQPITVADPVIYTPETQGESTAPQVKRRRAKRSEEERIDYLRSDPYVAQFEAYRVLCASCDKWIRLRPNSTYCSIPWDAHRKSCLSKKAAKASNLDERSSVFLTDPQVREFEEQRVLCKICDTWVSIGKEDDTRARQTWLDHRTQCLQSRKTPVSSKDPPPASSSSSKSNLPSIDSVPPSKHLMALVSSSNLPGSSSMKVCRPPVSRTATTSSASAAPAFSPTFKDLNPSNFAPSQESRRRNAEQRAASLRADPLIGEVEPNRVFCSVCKKWVQLRQDSSYCAYPWVQHRDKCLKRQQRRAQKEADLAEYRAQMEALRREEQARPSEDVDELDSDGSADSGEDELQARRRAERKEARRREKRQAELNRLRRVEEQKALLRQKEAALLTCSDEDAEGESDAEDGLPMTQFADLETPAGRLEFVSTSIRYLFKTTYEHADDLTIAALVTYLNAAMPPDKHEDFDTTEVTKAAMALSERGEFLFQGDMLRQR